MRKLRLLPLILAMMVSLSSCTLRDQQEESSVADADTIATEESIPEESTVSDKKDAPAAELMNPAEITVYVLEENTDIFTPKTVPVSGGDATLMTLASAVEEALAEEIPVLGITQQKGMVVVNLAGSFVDEYPNAHGYRILTTLAITMQQNHRSFEWIQYQLDGEVGALGEKYEIPPLKLLEADSEEFAAIRRQIPYEGLRYDPAETILDTDETGERLICYLSLLDIGSREIGGLSELKPMEMLANAVYATYDYTTFPDGENYRPELKPFEAAADEVLGFPEQQFWLQEHVEETYRLLYGKEAEILHQDIGKWRYLEALGVYTPPHMGGRGGTIPVLFSYQEMEDGIQAEVAYYAVSMGGYMTSDTWEEIPEGTLADYIQHQAKRYMVLVEKVGDDWFLLKSQRER